MRDVKDKKSFTGTAVGQKITAFGEWFKGLTKWKKITMIVAAVLILALLVTGIGAYAFMNGILGNMFAETPEDYDLSLVDVDGYINILLLGVDARDMSNIDGNRTDAIMVVSINKDTNEVKIASVYRDTFLKMGDTETYDKITHAFVYGGAEMTMKTLNQAMDLNISNYVIINFKVVADIVNAVGGIEVDVEEYEIQQLNKYTKQTANNIGQEEYQLVEEPGLQTLEGVQAVSYGRIRKGVGDDFKRTERMRTVLELVFEKVKTMSFSEVKDLIDLLTPQVRTNLKTNDILALGIRLPNFNITGSVSWPYDVTTGLIGGVSYVLPADLAANATQLHQEMFMQEDYVPSDSLYATSNEIAARIQAARDNHEIEDEKKVESSSKDSEKDSDDSSSKSSSSTSDSKNTDKDDSKSSSSGNNVDKDTNSSDSSSDKSTDKSDQSDKSSSSENTDDTGSADTDTETDTSTDTDTSGEDTTTDTDASDDKDDSSEADTPDVPEDSEDSDPDVPTDGETTDSEEAA